MYTFLCVHCLIANPLPPPKFWQWMYSLFFFLFPFYSFIYLLFLPLVVFPSLNWVLYLGTKRTICNRDSLLILWWVIMCRWTLSTNSSDFSLRFFLVFFPAVTQKALRSSAHIIGLLCPGLLAAFLAFGSSSREKEGSNCFYGWSSHCMLIE